MEENEIPLYKKPIFQVGVWIAVLVGLYIYQIFAQPSIGVVIGIFCNSLLLMAAFPFWMWFYAQFILPVHTLEQRSKILNRLQRHISKSHGPALFIKDGRVIAKEGELEQRKAGVIWLDTASAAVTRTNTAYKQVLGPGVHFTDDGEYLAGWLDLHTQVQSIALKDTDKPFDKLPEGADDETQRKYKETQERRLAVSALTRDGIEVIPNINVVFKIDADPAKGNQPGSRFGFSEEAVFNAIRKEGINPGAKAQRVAWNQFPALIAADLWREYAAKFTLSQLFEPTQPPLPDVPQPEPPKVPEEPPAPPPAKAGPITNILRYFNNRMETHLNEAEEEKKSALPTPVKAATVSQKDTRPKTGMQIINQMIKARMTQTFVPVLDESGRAMEGHALSEEFRKLQERGLRVLSVSVGSLRLPPAIEERTIKEWNANWLVNAQMESKRIERRITFVREDAKQDALKEYAAELSQNLVKANPDTPDAALRILLERSRNSIIRDERVLNRINKESAKPAMESTSGLSPSAVDMLRAGKESSSFDNKPQRRSSLDLDLMDQIIKKAEANDL
jgi:23S rRNA pseudoU1915 N3-methylase RlmH